MKIKMGILKSNEKGYQGWSNYETWATKLWMDNDKASYDHWHEITRDVMRRPKDERTDEGVLADRLKDEIEEGAPEIKASMYSDLLNSAISNIDFYEIAESLIADEKEA